MAYHLHGNTRPGVRSQDSVKRGNKAYLASCSDGPQMTIDRFVSAGPPISSAGEWAQSDSLDSAFGGMLLADRLPSTDPREISATMVAHYSWQTRLTRAPRQD